MSVTSTHDIYIAGLIGLQGAKIGRTKAQNSVSHSGVAGSVQTFAGTPVCNWSANGVGIQPGLFPMTTGSSKQITFKYDVPRYSATGTLYTGSISMNWDRANKQNPVTWSLSGLAASFSSAATGAADSGHYGVLSAASVDVDIDGSSITGGTSFASCLQTVGFTFSRQLKPEICGSSVFIMAGPLTGTLSLGLLDESVAGTILEDSSPHDITISTAGGDWIFKQFQFGNIDGPGGDRNTAGALTINVSGTFTAEDDDAKVIGPDEQAYFGTL